jgi:hypothetical protein
MSVNSTNLLACVGANFTIMLVFLILSTCCNVRLTNCWTWSSILNIKWILNHKTNYFSCNILFVCMFIINSLSSLSHWANQSLCVCAYLYSRMFNQIVWLLHSNMGSHSVWPSKIVSILPKCELLHHLKS